VNTHFQENISSGSYDDIRRKDLKLLMTANIVLQSNPKSATNDSTRGYGLNPFYADLIRRYPKSTWEKETKSLLVTIEPLAEKIKARKNLR
jgi:type II restriction enzyme